MMRGAPTDAARPAAIRRPATPPGNPQRSTAWPDSRASACAFGGECLNQLWRKGHVTCGLRGDSNDMNIIVDGVLRRLFRRLEQRADIHIEADIGESCGDNYRAAIMAILAHFHHQHPRAAAFARSEGLYIALDLLEPFIALISRAIHPCEGFDLGAVAAEFLFHCH